MRSLLVFAATAVIMSLAYTDYDIDVLKKTVWLEARGEPWEGQVAVAYVIKNRANANRGYWGGGSIAGVSLHPQQFEPWNTRRPESTHPQGEGWDHMDGLTLVEPYVRFEERLRNTAMLNSTEKAPSQEREFEKGQLKHVDTLQEDTTVLKIVRSHSTTTRKRCHDEITKDDIEMTPIPKKISGPIREIEREEKVTIGGTAAEEVRDHPETIGERAQREERAAREAWAAVYAGAVHFMLYLP